MTGKLIKYETKSSIKLMGIIWVALIAASLLLGITLNISDRFIGHERFEVASELLAIIPPLIYAAIFAAMLVITVLIIIMRFYRGMMGDEGYLMYTLPVKVWQLITSKGIVAAGIVLLSCIAAGISIIILGLTLDPSGVGEFFKAFFMSLGDEPKYILLIIEVIIILIASVLKSVYQIYAAMAVGQLAGKYRGLVSLGAYIGISIAISMIGIGLIVIADATGLDHVIANIDLNLAVTPFGAGQLALLLAFLLTAIQVAAFHVIAERILSLKLNLQ